MKGLPDIRLARAGAPGSALLRRQARLSALKRPAYPPLKPRNVPLVHRFRHLQQDQQHHGEPMSNATTAPNSSIPEEFTLEQMSDIRERVRMISETGNGYSQNRIAREAEMSSATLSQFLGDTYKGNLQNTAVKIAKWLNTYDAASSSESLPTAPAWVDTPTSKRIMGDLRYAQIAADLVLIVGAAGIGKSKTIVQYQATSPNVWHVELSAATGSLLAALEEIALKVGVRDYARSAAHLQRAIAERIRGTGGLLAIDEAQHLTVQAMDGIRWFNDKCGVGLVFMGNERVYTQMTGGNRAAYLDRLYSRVGKKTLIKRSAQGDADAIIKAWGIDDARCRDRIRDIAARPGALRVLNKVLRLAATYAQASRKAICCDAISQAAHELGVFE